MKRNLFGSHIGYVGDNKYNSYYNIEKDNELWNANLNEEYNSQLNDIYFFINYMHVVVVYYI